MARADTAEREARAALEQGTRRDYLLPGRPGRLRPAVRRGLGARPGMGSHPAACAAAAQVAALHGKKVFACRIPWTRAGINVAMTSTDCPRLRRYLRYRPVLP